MYTKSVIHSASLSVKLCLCILYLTLITPIPKETAAEMSTKLPEWARREKLKAAIFCLVLSFTWYPLVEVMKPMKSGYSNCPLPPVLPLWTRLFWSVIRGGWVGVCRAWWSFPTRKMGGCARACQIRLICMLILSSPNVFFELDLGYLYQKPVTQLVKERKSPVSQGLRILKCTFAL